MHANGSDDRPSADPASAERADVELRLPADGAYVSILRTTTAALAARLDFTLDDIEDLRMAVGEACAMVLEAATPESDLTVRYWLRDREVVVSVSAPASSPQHPEEDSFAWQVLTTLATRAAVTATADSFGITLTVQATPLGAGR